MIAVFHHLWQSTLFTALAALLVSALRNNGAHVRHQLWLAASMKFFVPFSLLVALGNHWSWRTAPVIEQPRVAVTIGESGEPFVAPVSRAPVAAAAPASDPAGILVTVWGVGVVAVLLNWLFRWRRIRALIASSSPSGFDFPVPVRVSARLTEPGVAGIFQPVLLLPEGIAERLTRAQLYAILAHELAHVRRRDNLTAFLHMWVESVFWFYPLVWWIGARLVEERERACDEEVLKNGSEPETYAEGLLEVCKAYVESPAPCMAGVTGANLRRRIETILSGCTGGSLSFAKKMALAAAGAGALAAPVMVGTLRPRVVFAQTTPGLAFVAADVHASAKDAIPLGFQALMPGSRVTLRGLTLAHLIAMAYDVADDKISGGPRWLDVDKFDVIAKPPAATSKPGELQTMLQFLLAERFQLRVKKEERKFPVYVWTAAKSGLRLKPSKSEEDGNCEHPDDNSVNRVCTGVTIEGLGRQLRVAAPAYFDREVIDQTKAAGRFDFSLKWTGKALIGHSPDAISLYDALERQYGIHTEQDVIPMPAIVVESANETPLPNPPATDAAMPPMPAGFEAAAIKINKDPQQRQAVRFVHGRIDARGIAMTEMIGFAYGIEDDDMIMGAPGWAEKTLYDLEAKTEPYVDLEGVQPMMQKLLTEQFRLKVHRENRLITVYALTALKGAHLTAGDASARGSCKKTFSNGLGTYTCENTTMAELAEQLPRLARGYLDHAMVDLTGMKGAYNFAVSWNGVNITRPQSRGDGAPGAAAEPGSGITLFTGLEKIGLKATKQKYPMPALVIDHVERTPSGN